MGVHRIMHMMGQMAVCFGLVSEFRSVIIMILIIADRCNKISLFRDIIYKITIHVHVFP